MQAKTRLLSLWIACAPLAGCTAIILNDARSADAPCEDVSDCAAGQRCEDEVCVDDDREGETPEPPERVGPAGGLVPGPGGVTLEIPAGALEEDVTLSIVRESSTIPLDGLTARSRFLRVLPELALLETATLTIPVADGCDDCAVYQQQGDAFEALPAATAPGNAVAGTTAELGLFVVAQEAP